MTHNSIARYSFALALGALLTASPAIAQGKGHGAEKARDRHEQLRPELRRRSEKEQKKITEERLRRERDQRREYEARRSGSKDRGRSRDVPPGWCVRGNPHNTVENCGYSADRRRDSRDGRDSRDSREIWGIPLPDRIW
jgi:hypothetical protein